MTRRVGIEISTTAVRLAVVDDERQRPSIVAVTSAPLTEGVVGDGALLDPARAASAVRRCVEEANLKKRPFGSLKARVSVAGLRAITREIELASIPAAELDAATRLQALEILPFPIEDAVISSCPLGASLEQNKQRILVAAAPRDLVAPVVEALEDAGLVVSGVDLAASALVRSVGTAREESNAVEAVISIGAELTTVVVHEAGEPCFVRTVSSGGSSVTREIARRLDVPMDEAENLKLALPTTFDSLDAVRPEMLMALRDGSSGLLSDVRSSLDYFASQSRNPELSRVVVTGGGALLPGLLDRLRLLVRAPVVLGDCFANLDSSALDSRSASRGPLFAVAVGMALADPVGRKSIDLLPEECRDRRRLKNAERSVLIGACAGGALFLGLGALRLTTVLGAESHAATLERADLALEHKLPYFGQAAKQHDEVAADAALVLPIVSRELNWPAVLAALAKATPSSVSASAFSGTVTSPATSATTTATTSSGGVGDIGTVNLTLSGSGYPSFQQWFNAMTRSGVFQVVDYSGLSSASAAVNFTAELGITKIVRTSRIGEFEEPRP